MADTDISEAVAGAKAALERLRAAVGDPGETRERIARLWDEVEGARLVEDAEGKLLDAIRRRPLTAVALAFGLGLAAAALARS